MSPAQDQVTTILLAPRSHLRIRKEFGPAQSYARGRPAVTLLLRCLGQRGDKRVCAFVVHAGAHEDIGRRHRLAVESLVPVVGGVDHRAVEVKTAVDALGATEGNEVGDDVGFSTCTYRACRDAGIATELYRRSEKGVEALVRHHQRDVLGHRNTGLEADAGGGEGVERRSDPFAVRGLGEAYGPPAGAAEDESGLQQFGSDDHGLGAADVMLQPPRATLLPDTTRSSCAFVPWIS